MAKVEIDTPGVTIRMEDGEASAKTLGAQALVLYQKASEIDRRLPTGPASTVNAERRGTPGLGFGTWEREATTPEARQING